MAISKRYGDTDFVTGLRAIAATMVVMVHTSALADFGPLGARISGAGAAGVQAFFVISGFSIASVLASRPTFGDFFIRRLVRIIPLYYLTLLIAFLLTLASFPISGWRDTLGAAPPLMGLALDFTFLGWIFPQTANDLIGVEWSIPIEIFWYVVLAGLLPRLIRPRDWLFALIGLLILAAISRVFAEVVFERSLWAAWAPTTYGAWFVLGALAYHLRPKVRSAPRMIQISLCTAAILSFLLGLITDIGLTSMLIGLATALIIMAHPGSGVRFDPLSTRPMLFLGTVSYGIYLWHMFAIVLLIRGEFESHLLLFLVTYALTVGVATASYILIERPATRAYAARAKHLNAIQVTP